MKKIFVLMICVLTLQNAGAAEIRPADIEYRYEGIANSGSISSGFMIREQETKRIRLTRKTRTPMAIKFSQPDNAQPAQELQLAETENKTVAEEAAKIKADQPVSVKPTETIAATSSSGSITSPLPDRI